jgi:hypothetical protein
MKKVLMLAVALMVAATPAFALSLDHVGRTARRLLTPVLVLQFLAAAFGAVFDVFLNEDKAWVDNAFFYAMRETWPAGPVLLAAVFCFVLVVKRRAVAATAPEADEVSAPAAR